MNWYRFKVAGLNSKHYRQWRSGRFLIRWRDQYKGVNIQSGYQALVRVKMPDGRIMLDFVWRYKVFRTRKTAMNACEDFASGLNPAEEAKKRKLASRLVKRQKRQKKLDIGLQETPKKRGRPKGSKNQSKPQNEILTDQPVKRRGRPKGSKNKPKLGV